MLNSLKNGVYSVDENRKIRFWSNGLETLTGIPSNSVVGSTFNDGLLKYEDEAGNPVPSFELPLMLCLQKKAAVPGYFFLTSESDERIPLEETAIPLFEGERFAGVVVSVRDISGCIKTARSWMKSGRNEKMIPICGWCKKIRSDTEKWEKLETYLAEEGFGIFTHGMCPSCAEKIFEKGVYLESYQKICKEISASISLDEVLHLIVTNVVKVMNVKASLLRLLNRETRQLELAAYYGLSEKYADKGPVSYDASIDDALAGKPVSVYDITEHKDSQYYRDAVEEGIRSILSIPLRLEKEVIGVLRMYTGEPVKYTDEDLQFMSAIAEQAAVAIFNARRFETAVSNEKEYLRVFEEITKAVSSTLDVNEVLDMIVKKIPKVMNLKAATVRLLDHTGKRLKLVASYGLSEKYLNKGPVDAERNIIEALKENAVAIYDVSTDSRIQYQKEAAEEGIKSMLTLPVVARGKILGILRLLTDKPRKFQQQEIDFVSSLAEQCGMAIENATMYERMKKDHDDIMKYVDGAVFERE
jgi:GAF domain-containing protein